MQGIELKPCPFCGGKAEFEVFVDSYGDNINSISCENLCISMEDRHKNLLIKRWNRRLKFN